MWPNSFACFLIALNALQICTAMYEDQVSKWDFRQRFVGRLQHLAAFDATSTQTVVIATEKNVLSSIYLKNGTIHWRHVLESGPFNVAVDGGDNILTVNANGFYVRSWSKKTGGLIWEQRLPQHIVSETDKENSNFKFFMKRNGNEMVFAKLIDSAHKLSFYNYNFDTQSLSEISVLNVDANLDFKDCEFVDEKHFICLNSRKLELYRIIVGRDSTLQVTPLANFGLRSNTQKYCKLVTFRRQPDVESTLFAIDLGGEGHVLVRLVNSEVKLVKILPDVKQVYIESVAFSDSKSKFGLFTLISKPDKAKSDSSEDQPSESSSLRKEFKIAVFDMENWEEDKSLAGYFFVQTSSPIKVKNMFIVPLFKSGKYSYKVLISCVDGSLFVSSPKAVISWKREEALAGIISAEILDLPLSELDATIEQTLGFNSENIVNQFLNRISSQVIQLQTYFTKLTFELMDAFAPKVVRSRDENGEESNFDSINDDLDMSTFVRDKFGLHKIIVVLSEVGKMFGIDNLSGKIVWSFYDEDLSNSLFVDPMKKLQIFVQRTTAHFPHSARCSIVTKNGLIIAFNPITGVIEDKIKLSESVKQTMLLHHVDDTYLKGVLILDDRNTVHLYPSSTQQVFLKEKEAYFIVVGDERTGLLEGYGFNSMDANYKRASRVWSLTLPTADQTAKKIQIVFKRHGEHVHSQGRVLGDRSVLYKYLNPNLMVIVTEGTDSTVSEFGKLSSFITIHLIDAVTGSIVYSSVHRRSRGPVFVVHSENSVVYSYYNEKSRRTEISSLELYEGKTQVNATSFSSIYREITKPDTIEHQNFIFPTGVLAMVDTLTEKGITNKHLLIALPSGGILELPKAFVDPRRPIHPTMEHREEGLIPYVPELPIPSEGIINYNKSIVNVKDIVTAPSSLESTCLVFAYGLDIFYTRVTPSKTFDILKDDFDHWLIAGVLLILVTLSYVSKWLAAKKTLNNAWK